MNVAERPILYSTPMVCAILEGKKTMTRRALSDKLIINDDPDRYKLVLACDSAELSVLPKPAPGFYVAFQDLRPDITPWISPIRCPYGRVGDQLWVREAWAGDEWCGYLYRADHAQADLKAGDLDDGEVQIRRWKPSIHMPKAAARIWLEITSIRVERLWEIDPNDVDNEGVESWNEDYTSEPGALHADYSNYLWRDDPKHHEYHFPSFPNPVDSYRSLWIKINGKDSWSSNPWVWVLSFKVLSTTGKSAVAEKEVSYA